MDIFVRLIMAKRKRYHYTFEFDFPSEEEKALFSDLVESVRRKMECLEGSHRLSKLELLSHLLAIAEALSGTETSQAPQETRPERLVNKRAATLDVESRILLDHESIWSITRAS